LRTGLQRGGGLSLRLRTPFAPIRKTSARLLVVVPSQYAGLEVVLQFLHVNIKVVGDVDFRYINFACSSFAEKNALDSNRGEAWAVKLAVLRLAFERGLVVLLTTKVDLKSHRVDEIHVD